MTFDHARHCIVYWEAWQNAADFKASKLICELKLCLTYIAWPFGRRPTSFPKKRIQYADKWSITWLRAKGSLCAKMSEESTPSLSDRQSTAFQQDSQSGKGCLCACVLLGVGGVSQRWFIGFVQSIAIVTLDKMHWLTLLSCEQHQTRDFVHHTGQFTDVLKCFFLGGASKSQVILKLKIRFRKTKLASAFPCHNLKLRASGTRKDPACTTYKLETLCCFKENSCSCGRIFVA